VELPEDVPIEELEERKGEAMKESWTKPEFKELQVSAECTAYAGSQEETRP
jgi:coenzyme PQQ precursor peptide PqqA